MRFGDYAMEQLLNTIYRKGGQRGRIEFKIFGGARVLGGSTMLKIGEQNIAFVEKFLKNEGFPIVARSVGGTAPRRLRFHPATGKAFVQELDRTSAVDGDEGRRAVPAARSPRSPPRAATWSSSDVVSARAARPIASSSSTTAAPSAA